MSESSLNFFNGTTGTLFNETEINYTFLLSMSLPSQLICLLGLAGNGVVMWFLSFRIQRNPFTMYILNLAVADFSILLSTIAALLYNLIIDTVRIVTSSSKDILLSMKIIGISNFNTSLLLLTAISVERCLSVFHPIWYKCHRPTHLSTITCVFSWVISICFTLLECLMCRNVNHSGINSYCTTVMVLSSSVSFGIIFPVTIISNLLLLYKVTSSSRRRQPMRFYRAIFINVLVFLVAATLPKLLAVLLFFKIIIFNTLNNLTIFYVTIFFATINSSANPYIYFFVGRTKKKKFSGSIKAILQRVFRNDHESQCPGDTINSCETMDGD